MLTRSAILTLKITFKPHNFADNNFGFSSEVTLTSAFDTKGTPGLELPYLHSTISLAKRDITFLHCWYSLGAVLQRREVFVIIIQHSHTRDMLSHSGPLGLAHRLLNVEPLPFGSISTKDCELM